MQASAKVSFTDIINCLRFFVKSLPRRIAFPGRKCVLGRTACLGNDVISILDPSACFFNMQKGRVDYLSDVVSDPKLSASPWDVLQFLQRKDIFSLIIQQSSPLWFKSTPPAALFMDSYSELTDQLFVHRRDNWRFLCNYSDLDHSREFKEQFLPAGLLPCDDLGMQYQRFFLFVRKMWGDIPIVFMHFPVKLDKREKFKLRYQAIYKAISELQGRFQPFYSLAIDETVVDWPEVKGPGLEEFPYHFNLKTYQAFAEKVRATGALNPDGGMR